MYPVLFECSLPGIGPVTLHSYGVFLALGALLGTVAGASVLRRDGLAWDRGLLLILACAFTGLVTGRISHQVERWWIGDQRDPASWDGLLREAGSYHVGIVFGLMVGLWLARGLGIGILPALDALGVASAAGQGVGRIGCFLAGCCWGTPAGSAPGVCYPPEAQAITGVPSGLALHPVMLYESAWLLIVTLVLLGVPGLRARPGRRAALFLSAWGAGRFGLEFLRGDPRVFLGPLSTPQAVGLAMALLGGGLWCLLGISGRGRPDRSP